jgi:hypothetical protein
MKGYLQRLVRTATNPAESIHPWEGSLFAAVHRGDFSAVQTEESVPAAASRQWSEVMSPASEQYSQPSVRPQASPLVAGHNPQTSESRTTYIGADFTQAERSVDRGPSVTERIIFEPLISHIEKSSTRSTDATNLETTHAQESETALPRRDRHFLPSGKGIIKPNNPRRRAVASPSASEPKTPDARAVGSPSAPQPKRPDARAVGTQVAGDQRTDEIQIHIGRIEVTAIHPPAPAVPKERKKEISLNDYLKRRNGRAG